MKGIQYVTNDKGQRVAVMIDLKKYGIPKIESLAREPRPVGCRKLEGAKSLWRVRIGDYGVVYAIYDDERRVDIVAVRHRSKAHE